MTEPREPDRLERLLAQQRLVCKTLDLDPVILAHDARLPNFNFAVRQRRDRWLTWVHAVISELVEAGDETAWKPWTTDQTWDEEAAFGELRDAWQFLTDLMFLVTGLPADELADKLEAALKAKSQVNLERVRNGDDGQARRCPRCKRSMDEPGDGPRCTPTWCKVYDEGRAMVDQVKVRDEVL